MFVAQATGDRPDHVTQRIFGTFHDEDSAGTSGVYRRAC
jgi:hypothetical protein